MPSPGAEVSEGCVKVECGGRRCCPGSVARVGSRVHQQEDRDSSEGSEGEGSQPWQAAEIE